MIGDVSIDEKSMGLGQPWIDDNFSAKDNFSNLGDTLQFELDRGQLTNFQLRLGDRHSMAFGLETRVPFLSQKHRDDSHKIPFEWKISDTNEKMALRAAANLTNLPKSIINRPKIPAGTSTTPKILGGLISELTPHALEWAKEYGRLSPILIDQPDMAIGIRLFHALHFTDYSNGLRKGDVMDLVDDVSDWNNL